MIYFRSMATGLETVDMDISLGTKYEALGINPWLFFFGPIAAFC